MMPANAPNSCHDDTVMWNSISLLLVSVSTLAPLPHYINAFPFVFTTTHTTEGVYSTVIGKYIHGCTYRFEHSVCIMGQVSTCTMYIMHVMKNQNFRSCCFPPALEQLLTSLEAGTCIQASDWKMMMHQLLMVSLLNTNWMPLMSHQKFWFVVNGNSHAVMWKTLSDTLRAIRLTDYIAACIETHTTQS